MNKHIHTARKRFPREYRRAMQLGRMLFAAAAVTLFAACGTAQRRGAANASPESAEAAGNTPKAVTAQSYPIDSLVTLRGRVVLAHEVRAFTPEGDTTEYWIVDRSGVLERAYDSVTGGQKNGKPAWAGLKVRYKGPSDEGFAAEYEGVFEVEEVISVEKTEE